MPEDTGKTPKRERTGSGNCEMVRYTRAFYPKKNSPRQDKMPPKMTKIAPKMPEGPKIGPKCAPNVPKVAQNGAKWVLHH